jgi:hypothetical protein
MSIKDLKTLMGVSVMFLYTSRSSMRSRKYF